MKEVFSSRLTKFINFEKLKKTDFGKRLGRDGNDKGYYTWFAASANPTAKNIEEILMAFPHLNANWLVAGLGPMIVSDEANSVVGESNIKYERPEILTRENLNKMIENMIKLDEEKRKLEEKLGELILENQQLREKEQKESSAKA